MPAWRGAYAGSHGGRIHAPCSSPSFPPWPHEPSASGGGPKEVRPVRGVSARQTTVRSSTSGRCCRHLRPAVSALPLPLPLPLPSERLVRRHPLWCGSRMAEDGPRCDQSRSGARAGARARAGGAPPAPAPLRGASSGHPLCGWYLTDPIPGSGRVLRGAGHVCNIEAVVGVPQEVEAVQSGGIAVRGRPQVESDSLFWSKL